MRSSLLGVLLFWLLQPAYGQTGQDNISRLQAKLDTASTDSVRVVLMSKLGIELKDRGRIPESRRWLGRAQSLAKAISNPVLTERVVLRLGDFYLSTAQPDSAIQVLEDQLERYPDSDRKLNVLNLLATAYREQAVYDKSLQLYEQAKSLVDSTERPRVYNIINQNMAGVYESKGNVGAALKYYQRGLDFAEAAGDSLALAITLNNLGNTYVAKSDFQQATYYLEKSIAVARSIDNKLSLLRSYNNLANAQSSLGNMAEGLELYNKALELHKQLKPNTPPFRIIYNLGDLQLKQGKFAEAEHSFQQSLEYSRQMGIPQGLYFNYTGLGSLEAERNNLDEAIKYIKKGIAVAEKLNLDSKRVEATQQLYQLYERRGSYQKALETLKVNKTLSDSLQKIDTEKKLAETESELELRKEREVNQLLLDKQNQQQARLNAQYWLIVVGIGIIITILGSMVLLYRSYRQRKKINQELEDQRGKLQELNQVKDKMLAIISHDLRSPLASMKGMLYLLREDELSRKEIDEMATELELSLNQNLSMMDNLLAWARQQMSGLAIDLQTVNAREITEEVIESYNFQAQHKSISLENKVPEMLLVKADFNLLKLILRNLISNAIKFSEEGDRITISTQHQDGKIVFEVADTGIGIPKETRDGLFAFNHNSRSGTKDEKGSGLGLQLCKEFVEKQNGEISMQSTEGEGTSFYFSLPQAS